MDDKLNIEILESGEIRITTDAISGANHRNAEDFLAFLARVTGGEVTRIKRPQTHSVQPRVNTLEQQEEK